MYFVFQSKIHHKRKRRVFFSCPKKAQSTRHQMLQHIGQFRGANPIFTAHKLWLAPDFFFLLGGRPIGFDFFILKKSLVCTLLHPLLQLVFAGIIRQTDFKTNFTKEKNKQKVSPFASENNLKKIVVKIQEISNYIFQGNIEIRNT